MGSLCRRRELSRPRLNKDKRGEALAILIPGRVGVALKKEREVVRMSNAKIVNHGVDTLVVNAYCVDMAGNPRKGELHDSLARQLEEWKKGAQEVGEPVVTTWLFQGVHLLMRPNGAGRGHWQWLLTSHLLNINISRGKWNGGIAQIRFSSEYSKLRRGNQAGPSIPQSAIWL